MRKTTLNDIVNATGYSKSTVSKVLNNKGRIGDETKKIVLDTAKKLNYIPDYYAQTLKNKKSSIIGVVFPENTGIGLSHPFFSGVIDYFKKYVENLGYEIIFLNLNMGNKGMSYVDYCKYRKVEGVLIVTFNHDDHELYDLIHSNIPSVCLDYVSEKSISVVTDDFESAKEATTYLLDQGHTNILHIAGPLTTRAGLDRFMGYQTVMNNRGYPDFRLEVCDEFNSDAGYEKMIQVIKNKDIPTAIFCASDGLALGVMKALYEHDIKVPEDVSIIGHDDNEFLQLTSPPLTTMRQNKKGIGEDAGLLLLELINKKTVESKKLLTNMIIRKSVKNLNK